jgi:hypothetical protein
MSFREQLTSCPRCRMVIAIDSIMVDERATVRILGKCTNPGCLTQSICRDIDPLQIAAYESSLIQAKRQSAPPLQKALGH